MKPTKILYVDVSPTPSYGGSKRVLTNIFAALDRERWIPHALYYREGAYVREVASMGIWAHAPTGLPGQRMEGEWTDGSSGTDSMARPASQRMEEEWTESTLGIDSVMRPASDAPGSREIDMGRSLRTRISGAGVRRDAGGWVERSWARRTARNIRAFHRFWIRGRAWSRRLDRFLPPGVDLIHFNGPMHDEHYEWAHLARRLRIPFVTHEHGPWRTPPDAFRLVCRRAASVLCLTEERIDQITRFSDGRVRADLVPNGVAVDKLTPRRSRGAVRAELGVGAATLLLITPAHIQAYKGQLLAVEVAGLLDRKGLDFRWIFCGAHLEPDYLASVRQRSKELRLGGRIVILGERNDIPDLLAASDLLVHTSIGPEAFGMVVAEAMGVGTPVVGPAEGAVPSILRDGLDGILYEPRDADAMAGAILRLAESPEERARMGESGKRRVADSFSLDAQVRRLCEIYERALG